MQLYCFKPNKIYFKLFYFESEDDPVCTSAGKSNSCLLDKTALRFVCNVLCVMN